jgi:hypothetical protein
VGDDRLQSAFLLVFYSHHAAFQNSLLPTRKLSRHSVRGSGGVTIFPGIGTVRGVPGSALRAGGGSLTLLQIVFLRDG